jgi:hypothetical protein
VWLKAAAAQLLQLQVLVVLVAVIPVTAAAMAVKAVYLLPYIPDKQAVQVVTQATVEPVRMHIPMALAMQVLVAVVAQVAMLMATPVLAAVV